MEAIGSIQILAWESVLQWAEPRTSAKFSSSYIYNVLNSLQEIAIWLMMLYDVPRCISGGAI